jgi:hypothetical protein
MPTPLCSTPTRTPLPCTQPTTFAHAHYPPLTPRTQHYTPAHALSLTPLHVHGSFSKFSPFSTLDPAEKEPLAQNPMPLGVRAGVAKPPSRAAEVALVAMVAAAAATATAVGQAMLCTLQQLALMPLVDDFPPLGLGLATSITASGHQRPEKNGRKILRTPPSAREHGHGHGRNHPSTYACDCTHAHGINKAAPCCTALLHCQEVPLGVNVALPPLGIGRSRK